MSSGFQDATNVGKEYDKGEYSPRGKFGPRDAGSVLANAPLVGIPAAFAVAAEAAAVKFFPGAVPMGMASIGAWLVNMLVWFLFKVVSAWLRNYGGSFLRDMGAALWNYITSGFTQRRQDRKDERTDRRDERIDRRDRRKPRKPRLPWRR